jgi:hypothetical protein
MITMPVYIDGRKKDTGRLYGKNKLAHSSATNSS